MSNLANLPTSADGATELRLAAMERQMAGLAAQLQLVEQQNLALEARVARLAADAFVVKTLEEMIAATLAGRRPAAGARPRHLHLAGGAR